MYEIRYLPESVFLFVCCEHKLYLIHVMKHKTTQKYTTKKRKIIKNWTPQTNSTYFHFNYIQINPSSTTITSTTTTATTSPSFTTRSKHKRNDSPPKFQKLKNHLQIHIRINQLLQQIKKQKKKKKTTKKNIQR